MKRKKQVFTVDNLIHMFCNKVDCNGLKTNFTSNGVRQIFVENDVMYSYGYHYPMAKWHGDVLLINSEKNSNTTNKHRWSLYYGVPDILKVFYVPDIHNPTSEENIVFLRNQIVDAITYVLGKGYYGEFQVGSSLTKYNSFASSFGLAPIILSQDWIDILDQINKEKEIKFQERQAKRQELLRIKYEKAELKEKNNLELWLNGEIDGRFYHLKGDFIRLKGDEVQTTRGVTIPLNVAKKAYWALSNNALKVGDKIEHYEVLKIDGDLLKIGCHNFSIEQIKKCFNQ